VAQRVGIVGASGYGGAELVRLLDGHPDLGLEVVAAHQQAGAPVASLYPNLPGERLFDEVDLGSLIGLDLVFLATPHGPSLQLGTALRKAGTRVVDLSGAFRLSAGDFSQWYGEEHPAPELAPDPDGTAAGAEDGAERAVYGLPELFRDQIAGAGFVANPGCYPTAALLALAPVAELLEPGSVVIDGKSGTSGAGRAVADRLHFSHVHGDLTAYGAPTHRHTGEIETWLPGDLGAVSFTPHLIPMSRGLFVTAYGSVRPGTSASDVTAAVRDAYEHEPFVHVLDEAEGFPHTKALAGSNGVHVTATLDERVGRVLATCAIDNLGKGAAGQALQNANLMLGLPETTALSAIGVYP
jgi:N-acetyl-gamma-glutamyl-phosphate reductase